MRCGLQELSGTILRFLAAQQQTAGNCPPFTGSVAFVNSPRVGASEQGYAIECKLP